MVPELCAISYLSKGCVCSTGMVPELCAISYLS